MATCDSPRNRPVQVYVPLSDVVARCISARKPEPLIAACVAVAGVGAVVGPPARPTLNCDDPSEHASWNPDPLLLKVRPPEIPPISYRVPKPKHDLVDAREVSEDVVSLKSVLVTSLEPVKILGKVTRTSDLAIT